MRKLALGGSILIVVLIMRLLYLDPSRHFGIGIISPSVEPATSRFVEALRIRYPDGTKVEKITKEIENLGFRCYERDAHWVCYYDYANLIFIGMIHWRVSFREKSGQAYAIRGSLGGT